MDRKFAVRPVMRWPPQPRAPTLADAKHLFDLCLLAVGHHHALIAEFLAARKENRFAKVVMLDVPFFPRIPLPTEVLNRPLVGLESGREEGVEPVVSDQLVHRPPGGGFCAVTLTD